jgi:hypothetical protein
MDMYMDVDVALAGVPMNIYPVVDVDGAIIDDLAFDVAGLDLVWNFVTTAGVFTQTSVTPTESAGDYDWAAKGNGIYTIEIPASGGASINNDTEGFGWFTGQATGTMPWRGPVICFRAAGLNDKLIDSAYSATRALGGTALPDAAADAAGGLPISDAGALDLDTLNSNVTDILTDTGTTLNDKIDTIDGVVDAILVDTGTTLDGRIPAALVSGRMDSSVGAMAAGTVTATAVATGAIDADALAADAVDEILDEVIEGTYTLRQMIRLMASALLAKVSGGGTTTITFRDTGDTKDRIVATVDANGNRTAVTLTET